MMTPKNTTKVDVALVEQGLVTFTALIQSALASTDRGRFQLVQRLASQADMLQAFTKSRVGDFDEESEDGELQLMGGGINIGDIQAGIGMVGGPRRQIRGGDQMELLRTVIDTATAAIQQQNAPKRLAPVDELNSLLDVRMKLRDAGEETTDLDGRITVLRKELTNVVVPADVLRGHPVEAPSGHGDAGDVGEAHGDGADGARDAAGQGAREEVG
jgi:hypothetical protein